MIQASQIEGYEGFETPEMYNDTPPDSVQVKFWVNAIEQPFESEKAGRAIYKNVVYISKTWELGRSSLHRPIRDKTTFDEASKKWKVTRLAANSDIAKYTAEWNAFQRGQADNEIGTPLMFLFKNDPSRVEFYKDKHITTIERLAGLNYSNAQDLGLDVAADITRAQNYLKQTKEDGAAHALKARLEEKDLQVASLQEQLKELQSKLTKVLSDKFDDSSSDAESAPEQTIKRGRGRPKKAETANQANDQEEILAKLNADLGY